LEPKLATGAPTPQTPTAPVSYRRNAARLTTGQLRTLRRAFAALYEIGDERGYAYHAGIHGLPLPIGCDNAHGTPYFLPWHRAYLYFFERALRDQVDNAGLVWWDWRRKAGQRDPIPPAYAQRNVAGARNPLYAARVSDEALRQGRRSGLRLPPTTRRRPGDQRLLPTPDEVTRALERRDFLDFNSEVEELHNRIHVWVGEHMSQVPYASFDPIFWGHHTMIDRLWRIWQLRHPGGSPPASILDEALPPFRMTVRQTLNVTALGYDYAVSSASADG
jgi:tyrosinase